MTNSEMLLAMRSVGAMGRYQPTWKITAGCIFLKTNRPGKIVEGSFHGCNIVMMPNGTFNIRTDKKEKAKKWAGIHKVPFYGYKGEAELFVPGHLADKFLPAFGAKINKGERK